MVVHFLPTGVRPYRRVVTQGWSTVRGEVTRRVPMAPGGQLGRARFVLNLRWAATPVTRSCGMSSTTGDRDVTRDQGIREGSLTWL